MRILDYLDSRLIAFFDAESRDDAIHFLIDLAHEQGLILEKEPFSKAIFHREELVSTGIGMGIAIPHAKLTELDDFFIVAGIQRKRGIEWNALDRAPVRLIFLIGGPENRQAEYLQILSLLTSAVKEAEVRKKLLNSQNSEEVLALFSQF